MLGLFADRRSGRVLLAQDRLCPGGVPLHDEVEISGAHIGGRTGISSRRHPLTSSRDDAYSPVGLEDSEFDLVEASQTLLLPGCDKYVLEIDPRSA